MILKPIDSNKKVTFNPFDGPKVEKVIFSTQPQVEIWLACNLGGEDANRSYNESTSLVLNGNLDIAAFEFALNHLVKRHEALRAVFSTDGRYMSILEDVPITIDYNDVSHLQDSEIQNEIAKCLLEHANMSFDLVRGPLLKAELIKLNEIEHHLVLTAHHIICDGWSTGIMMEELGTVYSAKVSNESFELPEPISYSDYADEHQSFLVSEEFQETEEFWLNQYKSNVPQLNLPTDFPRPELRDYKSDRLDFHLNSDLLSQFKKTGIRAGSSFVTTLMTAFELFLCKQTGQNDIVLGLPAAGQSVMGKTQLIGHCVNLLPLRSEVDLNMPFNTYLKSRKSSMFDAYDHQQLSFGQLLQKLSIPRDPSRIPLVPVVFNIDMGMSKLVSFKDLSFKLSGNPRTYEAFEIFLNASGSEEDLVLEWQYNSSLFKKETIEKMMVSLEDIIKKIIANPETIIGDLIKADETEYLDLNNTKVNYPQQALHELIALQSKAYSNKQAIKFEEKHISYSEFDKQANQLANQLYEFGVESGQIIGVALPRSIELVVTLVAIMKCGAAYLPLDANYPSQRLNYMLDDSETRFLITTNTLKAKLNTTAKVLILDDLFGKLSTFSVTPLEIKVNPKDVAYILYTSGSTGKPKGVSVTHKNLVNFLYSMLDKPGIEDTDKLLSLTTISFDIAGLELYIPLLKGAELIIANDETAKDSRVLLDVIKAENITIMQATPTTWQMLLDAGWETPIPLKALCGGEALSLALAKRVLNLVDELWNMYGPTETTIWSSVKQIKKEDELITIGKPIANTQLYLLNKQGLLIDSGKIGEICIAGDGVTNGYWKRPELTKEKFTDNSFGSDLDTKLYKTGDLGKLLPSGEIQCLGRIDQQVKIRGHRIELEEIEKVLDVQNDVQSSVVLVNNDRIVAYVLNSHLTNKGHDKIEEWKKSLSIELPPHMVPQEFYILSEFPTTLNGKIDRQTLAQQASLNLSDNPSAEPRNETEKLLISIWEDCINIKDIDIYGDFFELGGHSMIAVRVMTRLEKELGRRFPLSALLEYPTVEKLAAYINEDKDDSASWNSLTPIKTTGNKPPLYIVHGADHNVLIFQKLAKSLDINQPVYGLQAKGLNDIDEPHDSVESMAAHYISEIIESNPEGPYALAGYSFGGVIIYEMAKQLKAQNREVSVVVLLDSYVYPIYRYSSPFKRKAVSIVYKIGQLGFVIKTMFSNRSNFNRRLGLIKESLHNIYLKFKLGKEKQHNLLYNWPLKLDEMHKLAFYNYVITPDDIEVDLLKVSENNIYFAHDTKHLGWEGIALGGIRRHLIQGNHSNMFESPNSEKLGETLQGILDGNN